MKGAHSDAEMMIATQIAYLNIKADGHQSVNVSEWIRATQATLEQKKLHGGLSPAEEAQLSTINNIHDLLGQSGYGDVNIDSWTVVASCNNSITGGSDKSGMYASLIDTGNGNAIVGFRGSESFDREQTIRDWLQADLGLHNSAVTWQQQDAEKFMQRIYKEYGDKYECFDITGHSLGGNLAGHATITVPEEMRDKIGRCVSFDGPGYSEEYLATHATEIAAMSDKIDHYSWSIVGSLLLPLPGSHYRVIDAKTPEDHDNSLVNVLFRHATENVRMVDGHVVDGERDPLAAGTNITTKIFELTDVRGLPLIIRGGFTLATLFGAVSIGEITNFYHKITDAAAEFSVNTAALYESSSSVKTMGVELGDIAGDIRAITSSIEYFSGTALLCRGRLRMIARSLEGDRDIVTALSEALEECANEYIAADRYAASHLAI